MKVVHKSKIFFVFKNFYIQICNTNVVKVNKIFCSSLDTSRMANLWSTKTLLELRKY